MATKNYKLTDNCPVHTVTSYAETPSGLLIEQTTKVKGIAHHGSQSGVITDEKLTDDIAEYLLDCKDELGNRIYKDFIVSTKVKPVVVTAQK